MNEAIEIVQAMYEAEWHLYNKIPDYVNFSKEGEKRAVRINALGEVLRALKAAKGRSDD